MLFFFLWEGLDHSFLTIALKLSFLLHNKAILTVSLFSFFFFLGSLLKICCTWICFKWQIDWEVWCIFFWGCASGAHYWTEASRCISTLGGWESSWMGKHRCQSCFYFSFTTVAIFGYAIFCGLSLSFSVISFVLKDEKCLWFCEPSIRTIVHQFINIYCFLCCMTHFVCL